MKARKFSYTRCKQGKKTFSGSLFGKSGVQISTCPRMLSTEERVRVTIYETIEYIAPIVSEKLRSQYIVNIFSGGMVNIYGSILTKY